MSTDTAGSATRAELVELADRTLAEYLRYLARYGGATLEQDGLLLFAGPHRQPNPYRNGALRLDSTLPADEVPRRAARFFGPRQTSYALWTRAHAAPRRLPLRQTALHLEVI